MLVWEDEVGANSTEYAPDEGAHEPSGTINRSGDARAAVWAGALENVQLGTSLHSELVADSV
jgi:hypothetical protein